MEKREQQQELWDPFSVGRTSEDDRGDLVPATETLSLLNPLSSRLTSRTIPSDYQLHRLQDFSDHFRPHQLSNDSADYLLLTRGSTQESSDQELRVPLIEASPQNPESEMHTEDVILYPRQETDLLTTTEQNPEIVTIDRRTLNNNDGECASQAAKWLINVLVLVFAAAVLSISYVCSDCPLCDENQQQDNKPASDMIHRLESIVGCATKLSENYHVFENSDSAQMKASLWFWNQAGRKINVNDTECSWESLFGTLYSMVVLRESLQVPDASWYPTTPIESVSQVCRWARVQCNAAHQQIQGLVFNSANLNGTMPGVELAGLHSHLTNLELYSNTDLVGTIPTEIGRLQSLEFLKLHETSLEGTIPTEMGQLTDLKQLLLHKTNLMGTVPEQVCSLACQSLSDFHADCQKLHCCSAYR